jgi:Peptidase A4 family
VFGTAALLAAAIFTGSPGQVDHSTNWAGYAITALDGAPAPATFTDVTGMWTQPSVSCHVGTWAGSGFWVGLGGFSETSDALEQIGTSADCLTSGRPSYYAWYELVPAPPVRLSLRVEPGDRMLGAVAAIDGKIVLELKNVTRATRVTKTVDVAAPDLTSAEWIAEAPSMCDARNCSTIPLARFGRIPFGRAAATGDGHMGTITDPAWLATPIVLVPAARQPAQLLPQNDAGASPSKVTADGRAFSVTWGVTAEP